MSLATQNRNEGITASRAIDIIVKGISEAAPDATIYLFGSHAKGTARPDSDLDIYVLVSDRTKSPFDWMAKLRATFDTKVSFPVDLVVNYRDDFAERSKMWWTLSSEVQKSGRVMYEPKH